MPLSPSSPAPRRDPTEGEAGDSLPHTAREAQRRLAEAVAEQRRLRDEIERANDGLRQSGKLAGLGQLAAGVAHEINNPLGYVRSNMATLGSYVQDLLRIIDGIERAPDLQALRQLRQAMGYDEIRADIGPLLEESAEGVERIRRIVTLLKEFSHPGDGNARPSRLHAILDTTLQVANHEIRYKAEVVKAYSPELPEVVCDATRIQQVVLNLLLNAAQAIPEHGTIHLRTGHDAGWVWFEIEDDGAGMGPETLGHLFEPFFTTKPAGQGTGLGLSVSRGIVRQHGGDIAVESQLGVGTCFRVSLPLTENHKEILP